MIFKTEQRKKKFFSYYKPYRNILFWDLSFATLSTITTLIIPLCIQHITYIIREDKVNNMIQYVFMIGGIIVVLLLIKILLFLYTDIKGHAMGAMMESDMREELFSHYQKLSFDFYDEHKTGELTSRIFQDTTELGEFFHHAPEDIILYIVRFIGSLGILYFINYKLMLITSILLPCMAIVAYKGAKRLHVINAKSRKIIGEINGNVEESISGIRMIQSYTNENNQISTFIKDNKRFLQSRIAWYKSEAYIYGILGFLIEIISVVVVVFGAVLIVQMQLEVEELLTFLLYIGYLTEPLMRIMWMFSQYQGAYTSFHRFMDMLEVGASITNSKHAIELKSVEGNITFENVSFHYQEKENGKKTEVIRNLNWHINAGEYVAIVGASGVGKTTLGSLIPRFYDVDEGAVLIDGINVKEIEIASMRSHIAVVSQDIYLFSGTIYDNILFGKLDATFEEVQSAAQKAGIDTFITSLPKGYQTDVGERGMKLSGGQKQRIAIARAFLKDPAILILDEATSALDYESEQIVQTALEELVKNRTTIVIAHRLSTIKKAKKIVVLKNKQIVEQGTHQELLSNHGVYASLYHSRG